MEGVHAWFVEEREYRRQEERRGRRHAYEQLDPARTALIVVDMVPFFVGEDFFRRGVVPNVNRLAAALRAAGGTVAWVLPVDPGRTDHSDEFLGAEVSAMFRTSGGEGPLAERLWPELDVAHGDLVAVKSAASAFFPGRSDLPDLLQVREIDTVVITGTVTNVCCESSARDASTLGYRVIMVGDGCSAVRDQDHNATLHVVYRTFGDVRSTEEVVGLIEAGADVRPG